MEIAIRAGGARPGAPGEHEGRGRERLEASGPRRQGSTVTCAKTSDQPASLFTASAWK
jgi:hypothetical protein